MGLIGMLYRMAKKDKKISICVYLDKKIHKDAQNIIQNKMGSSLSKEIENYLSELVERFKGDS